MLSAYDKDRDERIIQGLGMDDEYRVPLRDIVREAREVKRPDMVVSKMDVLARKRGHSVTFTFTPTRDLNRIEARQWMDSFIDDIEAHGYEVKDVPRPSSTYNGQRAKKPELVPYLKSDGSPVLCKACKKPVVVRANGAAGCSNYADKAYQHHTYIAKDVIENGV